MRDDIKDLVQEQMKQKADAAKEAAAADSAGTGTPTSGGNKKLSASAEAAINNSKPLTSYFTKLSQIHTKIFTNTSCEMLNRREVAI